MDSEHHYLFDKYPQHHYLIDGEAKKIFSQGLIAEALKCVSGFNMHGIRDCAVNKNVIDPSCPRCSKTED